MVSILANGARGPDQAQPARWPTLRFGSAGRHRFTEPIGLGVCAHLACCTESAQCAVRPLRFRATGPTLPGPLRRLVNALGTGAGVVEKTPNTIINATRLLDMKLDKKM